MFNDNDIHAEETISPSSMLLMDMIKSEPKQVDNNGHFDKTDSSTPNEHSPAGVVEEFIKEQEAVINHNIQAELIQPEWPGCEYDDIWKDPDSFSKEAAGLSWWERVWGKVFIGIEVNRRMIRASKVRSWGHKQEIVQVEEILLDDSLTNNISVIAQQVKQILKKLNSAQIPITSIIGGPDVNLRLLRMPKVSKKEIRDALLWKNKKELHFFNDAPTILHYVILDEEQTPNAAEFFVLVIAVKEDLIKTNLEIMDHARVLPAKLTIRPIAQWNLFKSIPDKGLNSLLIDIGFETTHLTFYRNNSLQFARDISVGGNHFTTALMQTIFAGNQSYVLSWDQAESIKKEIGLAADTVDGKSPQGIPYSEIAVMMRPVAEKLASEIKISLDYYKENFKVDSYDNVYFAGRSMQLKKLKHFLESSIGQTIRPLCVSEAVAPSVRGKAIEELIPSMDTIGAALAKGSDLNFLPPYAKKELQFRNAFSKAISVFLIVLFVLGGSVLFLNKRNGDTNDILSILNNSLSRVRQENREFEQLQDQQNVLNSIQARILNETGVDSSMTAILKWISDVTPDEIALDQLSWGSAYNETEIRRTEANQAMKANGSTNIKPLGASKELHIKGAVFKDVFYADVHLLNFITTIERNPFFEEVQLKEKQRSLNDSELYFELVTKKK